jgi:hypothetical protein
VHEVGRCVPEGTVRARGEVVCVCTRLGGVCWKGMCVLEGAWLVCWCQSAVRGVSQHREIKAANIGNVFG